MSTDTVKRNFLGIPIEGEIQTNRRSPQKPLAELEPLIRALLDDEEIVSFGWHQYTPYFNDGETCVFSVYTPWFRTAADTGEGSSDDDGNELEVSDWHEHPTLGGRDWDAPKGADDERPYKGSNEARWRRCLAFTNALDSDAFDDVLQEAFGDHCEITVTRDGITVEGYSHD
jgi:hypothetical protein